MNKSMWLAGLMVLAAALPGWAKEKSKKVSPEHEAAQQAMLAKWVEASTPGEAHKVLSDMPGSWNYKIQFWMSPGAKAEQSDGTSEIKWVLGGRFLQQDVKGVAMGQPFEGRGTLGYNNVKKVYESTWIDNMATAMLIGSGTYNATAKTLTQTGLMTDCQEGKEKPYRTVTSFKDKDHFTYETYTTGPDGKEFLGMKIGYARKLEPK